MTYVPTNALPPAERRAMLIHCARVYLHEARFRRRHAYACLRGFHHTMLIWAGNARRQAAAIDVRPAQPDLFA